MIIKYLPDKSALGFFVGALARLRLSEGGKE
jgi:hypothetical protein